MNTHRTCILLSLLLTGCPGVWSGDWQAWLDEHEGPPIDTEPPTECGEGDDDCDGFGVGEDCDDADSDIYPGAPEIPYDGIDQDCDDADLTDVDGDGWDAAEVGGDDCDDSREDVNPEAMEIPCNEVDEDCDTSMVQDGMTASFAASGMAPSSVELDWDPVGQRVLAFFGAQDDGSCSSDTLRYRAFDEGLNLLVDQDITPRAGLGSGATVAPAVDPEGSPRLVAWSSCSDSLLLLAPSDGDDGDWQASTMSSGLGTVNAVDACAPDGDAIVAATVGGSTMSVGQQDGEAWSFDEQSDATGSWSGLDLACASGGSVWLASSDNAGLKVLSYDLGTGRFGSAETQHAGASTPIGGNAPEGEPWALFFEDSAADALGYAWTEAPGGAFSEAAIAGVGAGTGLADSGAAAGSDGHALLALIDGGGFHLRRIELSSGQSSTWSDTSLERSYADVVVDDQQRAWYLYGSDGAFKVGVRCPE